ncbi:MAG: L,D-transpeptidase family protein [Pseudonocardiales bacterium]
MSIRPPVGMPLPLRADTAAAAQVVTVVAGSLTSTTATLQAWDRAGEGWVRRGPSVRAYLGDQGLTARPSEALSATPIGSFTLTQAFGRAKDPGTRLPYFRSDTSDWWVTDPTSSFYNSHYRCSTSCPFRTALGENLYRAGSLYTYAVVIDYNRRPVTPGAGSAFFLHVTEFKPTTGCISIPEGDLVSILRWLLPAAHPRIVLGVS